MSLNKTLNLKRVKRLNFILKVKQFHGCFTIVHYTGWFFTVCQTLGTGYLGQNIKTSVDIFTCVRKGSILYIQGVEENYYIKLFVIFRTYRGEVWVGQDTCFKPIKIKEFLKFSSGVVLRNRPNFNPPPNCYATELNYFRQLNLPQ